MSIIMQLLFNQTLNEKGLMAEGSKEIKSLLGALDADLNLKNLHNEEKLTSWVYQITRNSILDYFKNFF